MVQACFLSLCITHRQGRGRQSSPECVLEWLKELSTLNHPLGDSSPSRGSREDSDKYPWRSNLDKRELGHEPSLVNPLSRGEYCKCLFLLKTWVGFHVGKFMSGQERINSVDKPFVFFQDERLKLSPLSFQQKAVLQWCERPCLIRLHKAHIFHSLGITCRRWWFLWSTCLGQKGWTPSLPTGVKADITYFRGTPNCWALPQSFFQIISY